MIFKPTPFLAMSEIVNCPDANTMLFGAVATGKQKAKLQDITAGIIISSIGMPFSIATLARIGMNKVAVAVLEVTSVKNDKLRHNANNKKNNGNAKAEES